jgi:hypothetical protein
MYRTWFHGAKAELRIIAHQFPTGDCLVNHRRPSPEHIEAGSSHPRVFDINIDVTCVYRRVIKPLEIAHCGNTVVSYSQEDPGTEL